MNISKRSLTLLLSLAVLILYSSACGGALGGSNGGPDTGQFTGTWEYTSSNGTVTCGDETTSFAFGGTVTFSEGANAPLLYEGENCTWDFEVDGDTAEIVPGQSCSNTDDNDVTTTLQPTSWTFEVNDQSASENASGNATVQDADGNTANCNFQASGSLQKVGQ